MTSLQSDFCGHDADIRVKIPPCGHDADIKNHQLLCTFHHSQNNKKIAESLDFTDFPLLPF